jgi:hypothetical protein
MVQRNVGEGMILIGGGLLVSLYIYIYISSNYYDNLLAACCLIGWMNRGRLLA